ncbi:MAG: TonB-dependent receptor plug domain-containing protein, partial [Flavisolibacter sp.]
SLEATSNVYCVQQQEGKTFFAARVSHQVPEVFILRPKKLLVYWDASGSALKRNLAREISFLKQYMQHHQTDILTLVPFGETAADAQTFYPLKNKDWMNLLHNLRYDGVTRMDQLRLANKEHDAVMVFTDGFLSYGAEVPEPAYKPLYTISTSLDKDTVFLKNLPGNSGGRFIDLSRLSVPEAIERSSLTYNKLMDVQSSTGGGIYEFSGDKNEFLLYGKLERDDTITFIYGNRQMEYARNQIVLQKNAGCNAWGIDRLVMLQNLEQKNTDWQDLLEFGLEHKIVTQHTAYIVLERIEDYIRYNIAPPKELEAACAEQGYITKSPKSRRQMLRQQDVSTIIKGVVKVYNHQLYLHNYHLKGLTFDDKEIKRDHVTHDVVTQHAVEPQNSVLGIGTDLSSLNEVVVTVPYGTTRRRSMTGSVGYYRTDKFPGGNDIQQVLSGRVPGVSMTPAAITTPGAAGSITIRGISSISGNSQPLYVLNGIPMDGNINDVISVNDIESITVLKDASAAAIYGSRAVNGVIVISSKKYMSSGNEYSGSYRLRDMDDEDYLVKLKETGLQLKWQAYQELRLDYGDHPNYYLDVAQHLFENGLTTQAISIIMNAAEVSNGDQAVLRAIGYSFESWKKFDKASEIYRQLLLNQPKNLVNYHDLAWSLYQEGKVEEAVRLLYSGIVLNFEEYEYHYTNFKALLLNDMNAMIHIHSNQLDFSFIPKSLLKPMPVDLRIVMTSNFNGSMSPEVIEPGGTICNDYYNTTKNGGYLSGNSYYGSRMDYNINTALKGKYRISLNFYGGDNEKLPIMYRIITYRNFATPNQTIEIKNVIMNNQAGKVEIDEVEW